MRKSISIRLTVGQWNAVLNALSSVQAAGSEHELYECKVTEKGSRGAGNRFLDRIDRAAEVIGAKLSDNERGE